MNWEKVTAIATAIYVILFLFAIIFAWIQTRGFEKNRKLEATRAIHSELQTETARNARKELYKQVPAKIDGIEANNLESYLETVQYAVLPYQRIGYLIHEKHVDFSPIILPHWQPVWRCWKKSENLIRWARELRGEPNYLGYFEHLYQLCEEHRAKNNLESPKIY